MVSCQMINKQIYTNRNKNRYFNNADNVLQLDDSICDLFSHIQTLSLDALKE